MIIEQNDQNNAVSLDQSENKTDIAEEFFSETPIVDENEEWFSANEADYTFTEKEDLNENGVIPDPDDVEFDYNTIVNRLKTARDEMNKVTDGLEECECDCDPGSSCCYITITGPDNVAVSDWLADYYGEDVCHNDEESLVRTPSDSKITQEMVDCDKYTGIPNRRIALDTLCESLSDKAKMKIDPKYIKI